MTPHEHVMKDARVKKAILVATAGLLPLVVIIGLIEGWHLGSWMVALTGVSMGIFVTIMLVVGLFACPTQRQKGEPRKKEPKVKI